jgi:hypothetical protein
MFCKFQKRKQNFTLSLIGYEGVVLCVAALKMQRNSTVSAVSSLVSISSSRESEECLGDRIAQGSNG